LSPDQYHFRAFLKNHGKIVLTLFWAAATFASAPSGGIHKKCDSPLEVDEKFSLDTGEMEKWGQGDFPRMLPPPLGERGGHPHSLSKRMESNRISHENRNIQI
jgi:hypothetical protein